MADHQPAQSSRSAGMEIAFEEDRDDELLPDELPSPDGDTFWHPDFYDDLVTKGEEC